jgi:predicted XRE-type DNA-binding protein
MHCPVRASGFNPGMSPSVGQFSEAEAVRFLGRWIRQARYQSGMSQRQLEWVCGVDQTVISRLENGRLRHMRLQRVARVLAGLAGYMQFPRGDEPMPARAPRRLPGAPDRE